MGKVHQSFKNDFKKSDFSLCFKKHLSALQWRGLFYIKILGIHLQWNLSSLHTMAFWNVIPLCLGYLDGPASWPKFITPLLREPLYKNLLPEKWKTSFFLYFSDLKFGNIYLKLLCIYFSLQYETIRGIWPLICKKNLLLQDKFFCKITKFLTSYHA